MKLKLKILLNVIYVLAICFSQILFCNNKKYSKWIVVTSINYPTKALKKLAALKDWHLVVVGDKKTPVDWYLENCDYLSPETQDHLGFHITKLLPWNHYSRKNIGYLYAIKNGATIIYDTDDDNILINDTISYLTPTAQTFLYETNESTVNTYAHFGQASIWPRGYPLDKILLKKTETTQETYPYIQQGLANLDPDVDAIFRSRRFFFDRIIELTDIMVDNNFYLEKDSDLVRAWLQDLHEIGYQHSCQIVDE